MEGPVSWSRRVRSGSLAALSLALLGCAATASEGPGRPSAAEPAGAPLEEIAERAPGEGRDAGGGERSSPEVSLIPGTSIEDTPENREVLELCERYRRALEDKDAPRLRALASPRYHDDGGTPDPGDDVDAAGLEAALGRIFAGVADVRYEMTYDRVARSGDEIHVDYTYTGQFTLDASGGGRVLVQRDSNRLVIERCPEGYRILSGM